MTFRFYHTFHLLRGCKQCWLLVYGQVEVQVYKVPFPLRLLIHFYTHGVTGQMYEYYGGGVILCAVWEADF